jgi:hypothetical protein
MISSEQDDVFGILEFVAEQELDCFDWVVASIHEITDKDVPVLRQISSHFEQFENIEELAVNVTAYGDRGLCLVYVWLFKK